MASYSPRLHFPPKILRNYKESSSSITMISGELLRDCGLQRLLVNVFPFWWLKKKLKEAARPTPGQKREWHDSTWTGKQPH